MVTVGMAGLAKVVTKHSKHNHLHEKETEKPVEAPTVSVDVKLNPCMAKVCDELRINQRTKTALEEYDATTLEDLAYMTNQDFESMVATATRQNRPICPLQQRKIAVLIWWVRNLVKDSTPFKEQPEEKKEDPNLWERMVHTPSEWSIKVNSQNEVDELKDVDTGIVIPRDWERQFEKDLPMLKKKLKEVGQKSSFSLYSDFFINLRWVLCGYQH